MSDLPRVTLYTDGACSGNPGPGGYGVVLLFPDGQRRELSGGFRRTTNNRMEIRAVVVGLEALHEPSRVTVFTDSEYVANSINKGWAKGWQAKGWMRNAKDKAQNPDLWARVLRLCDLHTVEVLWVRGHAGNAENERCDRLAVAAIKTPNLPADDGYEQAEANIAATPATITWEEFERVELRVGTITAVSAFPEAKKPAYQLEVDFGADIGVKRSSSQLVGLYGEKELLGKQVVGVVNFPPKKIGRFLSECLITGFYNADGAVVLAVPDKPLANGARLA